MEYLAIVLSVAALAFTLGSFWWLHARPGQLIAYEPTAWSAFVKGKRSALRVPLVLHNPGAVVLVVLELRLRFIESGDVMVWEWTRTQVRPTADDIADVASPRSIAGRDTLGLSVEFKGSFPGVVPTPVAHKVVIEARTSRSPEWHKILGFTLQLSNLVHPDNYIVYSNKPDYLSDDERAEGAVKLEKLRARLPEGDIEGAAIE